MAKTTSYESDLKELLLKLGELLDVKFEVSVEKNASEDGDTYTVILKADEDFSGLLIGSKGMTLEALQSFLTVAMKQKTGEWVRINLDIADWREKQNEYLENLAEQAAHRARTTGEAQNLYNLTAGARRVIHLKLANEKDIETASEGEGQDRYLVIRVK